MTAVELMLVVSVFVLIVTALGWAVVPAMINVRRDRTETDLRLISGALSLYLVRHEEECPRSLADLTLGTMTRQVDAWGREFVLRCEPGGEPEVLSRGPDGVVGTLDDLEIDDEL